MKKSSSRILLTGLSLFLIIGCSSKFEKEQRTVQQAITQKTAIATKKQINFISQFLSDKIQTDEDVNPAILSDIQKEFHAVSAIVLVNLDEKIIKIKSIPENFIDSKIDVYEIYLKKYELNFLSEKKNMRICSDILEIDKNKYLIFQIPLLDENQNLYAIALVFIESNRFFEEINFCFPYPYSLSIMNREGIILYHQDSEKTGINFLNTKSIQSKPTLKNLYTKMLENDISYHISSFIPNGEGHTKKQYTWHAITVLNTKWWISVIRILENKSFNNNERTYLLSTLRSYAIRDTLIDAILDRNWREGDGILKEIYQLNPNTYAIQLADENGTIVSGYPIGNRTLGYSYTMQKNKNFDNALEKIFTDNEEKIINSSLLEGGKGKFSLIPIIIDERTISVLISTEIAKK